MLRTERIPRSACLLQAESQFWTGHGGKADRLTVEVHAEREIPHRLLGKFAIDLSGIATDPQVPVLIEHDVNRRVGYAEAVTIQAPGLVAEVRILSNPTVEEVLRGPMDRFPWQASICVEPLVVERVGPGQRVVVNERVIEGPAMVYRRSTLKQIGFSMPGGEARIRAGAVADSAEATIEVQLLEAGAVMPMVSVPPFGLIQRHALGESARAVAERAQRENRAVTAEEQKAVALAERARLRGILAGARPEQRELAKKCINAGLSIEQSAIAMREQLRAWPENFSAALQGLEVAKAAAAVVLSRNAIVAAPAESAKEAWARLTIDERAAFLDAFEAFEYYWQKHRSAS